MKMAMVALVAVVILLVMAAKRQKRMMMVVVMMRRTRPGMLTANPQHLCAKTFGLLV